MPLCVCVCVCVCVCLCVRLQCLPLCEICVCQYVFKMNLSPCQPVCQSDALAMITCICHLMAKQCRIIIALPLLLHLSLSSIILHVSPLHTHPSLQSEHTHTLTPHPPSVAHTWPPVWSLFFGSGLCAGWRLIRLPCHISEPVMKGRAPGVAPEGPLIH